MILYTTLILCVVGLAPGNAAPSFTSDPANNIRLVGERFRVTCDSNTTGVQPVVTATRATVLDVSPQGTPSNIRIYESNVLTKDNNGAVFTCRASSIQIGSSITLTVQFVPTITGVMNITVNEGESATLNVTIDANPTVVISDIRVTPNLPLATTFSPINANTVSITIPSVSAANAGKYTITANNSVGMDSTSFVLTVIVATPTPSSSSVETQQVTVTETTSVTTMTVTTVAATMSSAATTSASPSPTGQTTTGNSGTSLFASAVVVLFLLSAFFFIN